MNRDDLNRRGRGTLLIAVLLSLAAAGISLMLTSYHLTEGKEPWALFRLACRSEEGGCADVLASPWAVAPGGIPTALLGAVYFGSLALWYLVVGRPRGGGRLWQAFPLGLNLAGAVVSIFLFSVMLGRLHEICYPLNQECNPGLSVTLHPEACEASDAAEAARELGGSEAFWKMHDALFQNQDSLGQKPWSSLAQGIGLDPAAVAERMGARSGRARIAEDTELGKRLGLSSTPTVYLDGKKMEDWWRLDLWKALVQ
jgi:uncharacterized membrane protein